MLPADILGQLFTTVLVVDHQGAVVDAFGCPFSVTNVFESAVLQPAEQLLRGALNGHPFEWIIRQPHGLLRLKCLPTTVGFVLAIDEPESKVPRNSTTTATTSNGLPHSPVQSRLARLDGLTGLANRLCFEEELNSLRGQGGTFGVIVGDVDNFKIVFGGRDGHLGDRALKEVARRIRTCVRRQDTAARLGGDQFAILIPEASVSKLEEIAFRVESNVQFRFESDCGFHRDIGVSIGVAHSTDGNGDVFRAADKAMLARKRARKTRN